MNKRIVSLMLVIGMLFSIAQISCINVAAASERDNIVSTEQECTWAYYQSEGRWYISALGNTSQKRTVYSLGPIIYNVGWLEVGKNAAKLNSNMTKVTVDNGLSSNTSKRVWDEGNSEYVNYSNIINDRKRVEGRTVDIAWYFFQDPKNEKWYIVNDSGSVSRMTSEYNNDGTRKLAWDDIAMGDYVPSFNIKNNKMYVKFEKESSSQTPPRLTGWKSMPSQIPYGKAYYLKGKIVSDSPITKVTVNVFRRDGSWKDSQSAYPNSYTFDLSIIDENLHFTKYPSGDMEIQIWAVNACGAYPLIGEYSGNKQIRGELFTIVGNSNSGKTLSDVASEEIGYQGKNSKGTGSGDYTKYGVFTGTNGLQWCASFVSWCVNQSGISTSIVPKTAQCNYMKNNSTSYNKWNSTSLTKINKNDVIFFSGDGTQDSHHVGIVYSVAGNKITLIEGNTGSDVVKKNTYTVEESSTGKIKGGKDNWKYFCGFISVD